MARLALTLAVAAVVCACLPSPGLYLALGLGLGAIGTGWLGYAERCAPGGRRLAGAAAITIGALGFALGAVRVAMVLAAIERMDRMLG